ncbi:MAG TPA: TadE/TadG family type IV pilus assembly protein [Candidatus Baltobacteraceae bacterium]|nr:TadE/TadG family type IV pilus assembly protein [Candidatus Baltobacteraceae bacterium]
MVRRGERGVALAEFALLLPLFMLLLLGLIEIGRLFYFTIQVGNAAHAGAQYASLSQTNTAASARAAALADGANSIDPAMNATAQNVCSCWNPVTKTETAPAPATCSGHCTAGYRITYAQVTVTGTINSLFNYSALGIPTSWNVSRTALMRVGL